MKVYFTKRVDYGEHIKYIEFKQGLTVYEKGDKYAGTEKEIVEHRQQMRSFSKDTGRIQIKHESVIQRARQTVFDIVACNDFDYFATFTFRPDPKIDRYSYIDTSRAIIRYLKHSKIKKYVIVYEQHKDRAYHYHALINIDQKHLKKHTNRVYNIKNYKYGFSTAVKIKKEKNSNIRIAAYLVKYMTKQFYNNLNFSQSIVDSSQTRVDTTEKLKSEPNPKTQDQIDTNRKLVAPNCSAVSPNPKNIFKYKKLYWCSRNLNRPKVEYNVPVDNTANFQFENKYVRVTMKS